MNKLQWFVYLASISEDFAAYALGIAVTLGIVVTCLWICLLVGGSDDDYKFRKWCRKMTIVACILGILGIFMPDKKTIYTIAGLEEIENVVKLDGVQSGVVLKVKIH